jgi:hypothetical protein
VKETERFEHLTSSLANKTELAESDFEHRIRQQLRMVANSGVIWLL